MYAHTFFRNVGQGFGGPGQMFKEGDDQCKKHFNFNIFIKIVLYTLLKN